MLQSLVVKNFAIVHQAQLDFGKGMTVMTGETGAGKSILIEALTFVLGQHAPRRPPPRNKKLSVSLCFDLTSHAAAKKWLKVHSLDTENDCILRRANENNTRAPRTYINGTPVTRNQIKEIGRLLADVTGQNAHQQLLQAKNHLEFLDCYCGHRTQTEKLRQLWKQWTFLSRQIENSQTRREESANRVALLRYQLDELETLAPEQGEFEHIESEHKRLAQAGRMIEQTQQARDILYENDEKSIYAQIARLGSQLKIFAAADANLARAQAELEAAAEAVCSAAGEMSTCLQKSPPTDEALRQIEARLSGYIELARKHRVAPGLLAQHHKKLGAELDQIDNTESDSERLCQQRAACLQAHQKLALKIRQRRQQGARALAREINQTLARLDMPAAHFDVNFEACSETPTATGFDCVEFMIRTHAGQPPAPLRRVASGGELSRLSLALQVAFAENHTLPTLVFDEVDAGIGGKTAETVGRLLQHLGRTVQVLCVTHLPQIAAFADRHYLVTKHLHAGAVTVSTRQLNGHEERDHEIARMLGGKKVTERALAHAREMLANGSTARASSEADGGD